ncbi:transposase family protein [Thiocapsa sp.]|uniref:transposase family protein n=1 Tax=Thiocapsa sp. TaxID=2024551 RepID=UPI0035934C1A
MDSVSLFTVALGLQTPREVREVDFDPQAGRIAFTVGFARGSRFTCPHCGAEHQSVHDTQAREWRHLNGFRFQAYMQAKVPRVRCGACGKITRVEVPWARPGGDSATDYRNIITDYRLIVPRQRSAALAQFMALSVRASASAVTSSSARDRCRSVAADGCVRAERRAGAVARLARPGLERRAGARGGAVRDDEQICL